MHSDGKFYRNTCCVACHSGQWLDRHINECIDCKAGHQCPSSFDATQNAQCDLGTYQPEPRQTACKGSGLHQTTMTLNFYMNDNKPVKRMSKRHELH